MNHHHPPLCASVPCPMAWTPRGVESLRGCFGGTHVSLSAKSGSSSFEILPANLLMRHGECSPAEEDYLPLHCPAVCGAGLRFQAALCLPLTKELPPDPAAKACRANFMNLKMWIHDHDASCRYTPARGCGRRLQNGFYPEVSACRKVPGAEGAVAGHPGGDTRRSPESPGDPPAISQAPGEGAEPPPCQEDGQRQEPGEAAGGPGRARGSSSSRRRRRRGLPWSFAVRRSPAAAPAPGQAGSGSGRALFGQPLAALCGEEGTLPRPIQELLAVLQREGPSTEEIFRLAVTGTKLRELREALDCGTDVELGSQPALLLAVILKDFLRSIPAKLLVTNLYDEWMAAMERPSKEEKMEELKV
ncbi:rho GTPase-activating protein 20-like isoform X2 [Nyctibius grandis]|uniref:rho GTPase-activating protein 20-like isoform X2 n=1 Tax=Nyctibius grandis TaxID=48427 RepID=UPI0035BBB345